MHYHDPLGTFLLVFCDRDMVNSTLILNVCLLHPSLLYVFVMVRVIVSVSSGVLLVFLILFWNAVLEILNVTLNVTVTLNVYYSLGILF